ncbi:MAG: prephenate dehydratase [Microscillaceae bacterium]|nr:prephenate dehydratase [Microscillaceae bacterium]MDW8461104.1 prephenate dehydratase [Cytophagales bacterium]
MLDQLRQEIDKIDNQLLALLNERMKIVQKIGELKKTNNTFIYRPEREKAILDRLARLNQELGGLLTPAAIDAIYMEIFAASRHFELPERVAYLGPEGSFCHQAAENRFGAMTDYIALQDIRSIFESVVTQRVRFGVVPIENNQEGFVNETIDLLFAFDVRIVAETLLPIHHTFASTCEKLNDIKQIFSKDIAFKQCRKFLESYFKDSQVEFIPVESTSKAVKIASERPHSAAICASVAAKIYRVPILFENIEDSPYNRTRFYIISKEFENQVSGNDKTTIIAQLPDVAGSLATFLQDFSVHQINLKKIESRPAKSEEKFNCWFYIEIDGHAAQEPLKSVLAKHQANVKFLGSYVKLC